MAFRKYHGLWPEAKNGIIQLPADCRLYIRIVILYLSMIVLTDAYRKFAEAYRAVQEEEACVVGVPSKDTVKIADEQGYVSVTRTGVLCGMCRLTGIFLSVGSLCL